MNEIHLVSRWFFGFRSMDDFCVDRPLLYRYTDREFRLLEWRSSVGKAH